MIIKTNKLLSAFKLSKQAFGEYKLQIIWLIILGFITGALEGVGINAAIPLISFATKENLGEIDIISKAIKNVFASLNIDFSVKYLIIFICLLFIFKAIALIFCNYIRIKISAIYEEQTRNNLFGKTINAKWPYLLKQKMGYLDTVLKVDTTSSTALLDNISSTVITLTGLIIYITVAVTISPYITLFALILGGLLFLCLKPLIYKARIVSQKIAAINKEVAHFVNENIMGIKTIKTLLINNKIIEIGKDYFNRLKQSKIKILVFRNVAGVVFQPISLIFVCIVFAFAYKTPNFSFASFIPITYLIYRIFQYVQSLQ